MYDAETAAATARHATERREARIENDRLDQPDDAGEIDRPKLTRSRTITVTIEMDIEEVIDARDRCEEDDVEDLDHATEQGIETMIAEAIGAALESGQTDYAEWQGSIPGKRQNGEAKITFYTPRKIKIEEA